ncbi:hypothetical protein [Planctomicrobium piriforme]|uniref:Uncharacterized protein n=1 Tax=Planctomicrobium piriforme TaxID=1576369 RepID=A0A1I3BHM4_9PLAN|nr:hypothetical protein [Planctomicrobium piriforme]SFH61797.1 hypothetical protein SAMN05421753_101460 [Planctomicrobium piriforme]
MNPLDELSRLTTLFSSPGALIEHAEHIPGALAPEPYKSLLVHEHHMTVTMEQFHGCKVNVEVLDESQQGDIYTRKIILKRSTDNVPVQFGLVRFDFKYVTAAVRDEIMARQTPLGRVLIRHNVLRHIDLGAILEISAGPELAALLQMPEHGITYGRLATIFCNRSPAVDLLEVSSQLPA